MSAVAPRQLTRIERRFVDSYLLDLNCAAAYRRAVPSVRHTSARTLGYRMRRLPHVAAEIRDAMRARSIRTQVKADRVVKELCRIAGSDIIALVDPTTGLLLHPRQIPFDVRRAIASFDVKRTRTTRTTNGRTRTTVREEWIGYRLANKLDALELMCKHLGLVESVPPLESLLRSLPGDLATALRAALVDPKPVTSNLPTRNPDIPGRDRRRH